MKTPRTTTWQISDLTRTKHRILRGYLEYWLPTALQENEHVYILDGFAGPGEYTKGEPGSPLIAINTLLEYTTNSEHLRRVSFLFIDNHRKRHYHLHDLINRYKHMQPMIETLNCRLMKGDFARILHEWLAAMETRVPNLAPRFIFIDPFGFSNTPLSHIARIMRHSQSEVLITFMYEELNRFLSHPSKKIQHRFTELFGTERWRDIDLNGDREQQICDLYRTQLQKMGNTKYVCMFRIKNKNNTTDYFLIFGTHTLTNLEKMKDIFWDIDPKDGHTFAVVKNRHQMYLIPPEPDYAFLAKQLQDHFQGLTVRMCELDEYILTDTYFRRKDREYALRLLEQAKQISMSLNGTDDPAILSGESLIRFI
jgi:three-Cys-motif partner protein